MKILCEVRLNVTQFDRSEFRWLKGKENYLFTSENERQLRMLKIRQDDGIVQEIQSASLSDTRYCTCISWNRDDSLLALVVDQRLIYFWDVKQNNFSQLKLKRGEFQKPKSNIGGRVAMISATPQANRKSAKIGDIELIAWSKVSDTIAICYATGRISLCQIATNASDSSNSMRRNEEEDQEVYPIIWERHIEKNDITLQRVVSIVVSESAEMFACFSATSEISIISFDGQTKFYCPGESNLFNAKFSPLAREYGSRSGHYKGKSLYLACQTGSTMGLYLKKVKLSEEHELQDTAPKLCMPYDTMDNPEQMKETRLVNFYWLDSAHLLLCLESGSIVLMRIIRTTIEEEDDSYTIKCTELFRIDAVSSPDNSGITTPISSTTSSRPASHNFRDQDESIETNSILSESSLRGNSSNLTTTNRENQFKFFELIRVPNRNSTFRQTFALAAATSYKLFYYELHELKESKVQHQASERFSFEHFDDIDLSDSLRRVNLKLERVEWNQDCSLISLQVTSGHLLIYETRLQNQMVVSYGSRTAFMSSADEVTILNYETSSLAPNEPAPSQHDSVSTSPCETSSQTSVNARSPSQAATPRANDKAIILSLHLKPSLIAIGPRHLALALNNRIRFYSLNEGTSQQQGFTSKTNEQFQELEYLTIVTGISLSSHYVAVQFDDGRLKLHGIGAGSVEDERFFPDPSQPELITAFTMTEKLFVFCTATRINVFSLSDWMIIQTCDLTQTSTGQIKRLRPNERGNQFVCLVGDSKSSNHSLKLEHVVLYDLYSNEIVSLIPRQGRNLWPSLVEKQISTTVNMLTFDRSSARKIVQHHESTTREPDQFGESDVVDAIWDTDGRSLLLVGSKFYHVFAILCHTLSSEGPICEYATSAKKPMNYVTLYISQGVVSYKTCLGRVINSILETHDEELKLSKLEVQIQKIKDKLSLAIPSNGQDNMDTSKDAQQEVLIDSNTISQNQANSRLAQIALMNAHLRITLLKVDYLCTILPMYPLTKCRDICKHIMEEETFNVNPDPPFISQLVNEYKLINQIIFKLLTAWSLFTLNLNFALLIYKRNGIQIQANLISDLLDDIKTKRMDSRFWVNRRILSILGMETSETDMAK